MALDLIGRGRVADVFAEGEHVLKLYALGFGPEQAQREAAILDVLEPLPIACPTALGVVEVDGRWGLRMSRMPGRTMAETAMTNSDQAGFVAAFAGLHASVLACPGNDLPLLAEQLGQRIAAAPNLSDDDRERLLEKLWQMPGGDRLCHGDFHPFNVMDDAGALSIIDWPDATCGAPEADIARAYLLIRSRLPDLAHAYREAMAAHGYAREAVAEWLPLVAAARLDEGIGEETDALLALCRGA
jgi:Serine/threonine protein kinase involved in cell cycle control